MLRRLVSSDRLDRGIWGAASDDGKAISVCFGCPCFFLCNYLVVAMIVMTLTVNKVLTQQRRLFVDVPCAGPSERSAHYANQGSRNLHHLQDCDVKMEGSTMKVGGFEWTNQYHTACSAEKVLTVGAKISFIGNTSNGILSPFQATDGASDTNVKICHLARGSESAVNLIEMKRSKQNQGFVYVLLMLICFVTWSSACFLFPDSDVARCRERSRGEPPDRVLRICGIGMLSAFVSCVWGLLMFYLGRTGWWIAFGLVVVLLAVGCSEDILQKCKQWQESLQSTNVGPDEERPLLSQETRNTSATAPQQPSRPFQTLPPQSATTTPEAPRQQPRIEAIPPVPQRIHTQQAAESKDADDSLKESGQVLAAIALGIVSGTFVGVILSISLSYLLE